MRGYFDTLSRQYGIFRLNGWHKSGRGTFVRGRKTTIRTKVSGKMYKSQYTKCMKNRSHKSDLPIDDLEVYLRLTSSRVLRDE